MAQTGWRPLGGPVRSVLLSILNLIYPETCVVCGAVPGERSWCAAGPVVPGLSWLDATHLCTACADHIKCGPVRARLPDLAPPVHGALTTAADLVRVLGHWKYHGLRGLAWPLSQLLGVAVATAVGADGPVDLVVPVPLHRRRRRVRGFNQAEVLARLVAQQGGPPAAAGLLRRGRATGQQAKLKSASARRENLAGAFVVVRGPQVGQGCRIGLVDDLVTSGATCAAAERALTAAGWEVRWVATLGVAVARKAAAEATGGQPGPAVPQSAAKTPRVDMAGAEF